MRRLSRVLSKLALGKPLSSPPISPQSSTAAAAALLPPTTAAFSNKEILNTFQTELESNPAKLWQAMELRDDAMEILYFMFKCKCQSLLDLTQEEFLTGVNALGANRSIPDLKQVLLSSCQTMVKTGLGGEEFREFFAFCFQASREGTIKTVSKDTVLYLLPICLRGAPQQQHRRVADFCEFLSLQTGVKQIKNDEWMEFLRLCQVVENLSQYDESDAWPLLLDDFVQWSLLNKRV